MSSCQKLSLDLVCDRSVSKSYFVYLSVLKVERPCGALNDVQEE